MEGFMDEDLMVLSDRLWRIADDIAHGLIHDHTPTVLWDISRKIKEHVNG